MSSGRNTVDTVEAAVAAFSRGEPVLIHDAADREGEVDIVYPATTADADAMTRLRNDAGGLVCVAVTDAVADAWDLPFLSDAVEHPATESDHLAYDSRSSFSLPVNHRETFTGITDDDRALTATELGRAAAATLVGEFDAEAFAETFRSPGHVNLLRGAPNGLADRQGHTELGLALAEAAGQAPAVVVCEMLDDETGGALAPAAARAYADRNGLVYVEGAALLSRLA
jgi:3,4-dihydroxy 2-butanone 4-phosphate synthase